MSKEKKEDIELRVAEAKSRDVGRNIVRIDRETMNSLGLTPGSFVEIIGEKTTLGIVWPGYAEDEGKGIIRMDGILRRNAGVSIGDYVKVREAEVKSGKKVVLAPLEPIRYREDFPEYVKDQLEGKPLRKGDMVQIPVLGMAIPFIVVNTQPSASIFVSVDTEVLIKEKPVKEVEIAGTGVTYEDIGDLEEAKQRIREMVELPMKAPELFRHLGIEPPKGILLHGPPGCGKTLLAKAVATETGAHFISINGPEIMSKYYGESEARLREIFQEAEENAPSIIFIDEVDAIAPRRSEVTGEVERRVVAQLLALMDGLKKRGQVIVIAATNRPEAVDPALRRPGRFDREISIGIPDRKARLEILQIHSRNMPLAEDVDLEEIASVTYGYSGADLAAICREAAMHALRRFLPKINVDEGVPSHILKELKVTKEDFQEAMREVQPSAMREVLVEVPEVHWEDIGGLNDIKERLREAVEWPLVHPEYFEEMGITPPKGTLLYGPPGCGKTLLAKAVATESQANFITVKGPEVLSKWVGESERAVREIFRRAKQVAPCIIFFDEIDAIAPERGRRYGDSGVTERVVNQLLTEMDGITRLENVIVIGATNRPDILDTALVRPGRFDRVIYVPPPDKESRVEIFKVHTKKMPLADDVNLDKLAEMTENYTGADIEALCREAAIIALREKGGPTKVEMRHFKEAMRRIPPSLTKEDMTRYELIRKRFQSLLGAAGAEYMKV